MQNIKNNLSTIIFVGLFIIVGMVIAIIMTLNTIEADQGFTLATKETIALQTRDQLCPFTAAEREDLLATNSIRQYVKIIDVYCDESGKEKVKVEYLGDQDVAKDKFNMWLSQNQLMEKIILN